MVVAVGLEKKVGRERSAMRGGRGREGRRERRGREKRETKGRTDLQELPSNRIVRLLFQTTCDDAEEDEKSKNGVHRSSLTDEILDGGELA